MAAEDMADRYGERVPAPHRQPRYRAIADELRRRISAGAIPAGALIPSESALTAEFQVARGTIRQAINALRLEGLVKTEHGRGTYVRQSPPTHRLGSESYQPRLGFAALNETSESEHGEQIVVELVEVLATTELAGLLEVAAETTLLKRRTIRRVNGIPRSLTISYSVFDGPAVASSVDGAQAVKPASESL